MALEERIASLPTEPGVYLLKSERGRILYVGKAQNLKSRVRSYASGGDGRIRIPQLLKQLADVDVVVTPTVKDALLLENELIKRHRPPFNVRLRDDKQYLALRLDPRAAWPRLTQVRRFRRDGALYFGPYTSSVAMRESLSQLQRIFPLRSCSDNVFRDYARRGRPCIEFEMKRCLGPCCDLVGPEDYAALVEGTRLFLRGRSRELVAGLRTRMQEAAVGERFEEAARLRDQIEAVGQTLEQQQIVTKRPVDRDVFGLARDGGEVEVQVFHVRGGRMSDGACYAFSDVRLDDGDVMSSFLGQYYGEADRRQVPAEVWSSVTVADDGALEALLSERAGRRVALSRPQRGTPRELVAMARTNAELSLARRLSSRESLDAALTELRERLSLLAIPRRIECYDVSNLQGTLAVASRVVFEEGRPVPGDYRRYRVREATAGDDLACLREVLARRLERLEQEPLPDLLMVDGGRGQLGVVSTLLADRGLEVDHVGLAKERDPTAATPRVRRSGGLKAERLFVPGRANPVLLPPSSRGLLLLQKVRDEAHRFAIEFQRKLRLRSNLRSVLEEVPGIGPRKRRALLRELGSLRAVRAARLEELAAVPGLSRRDAEAIARFFAALPEEGEGDGAPADLG
ncbi:MAG: excinuclease ABC subunit UvrC [Myxococcota bacterium]